MRDSELFLNAQYDAKQQWSNVRNSFYIEMKLDFKDETFKRKWIAVVTFVGVILGIVCLVLADKLNNPYIAFGVAIVGSFCLLIIKHIRKINMRSAKALNKNEKEIKTAWEKALKAEADRQNSSEEKVYIYLQSFYNTDQITYDEKKNKYRKKTMMKWWQILSFVIMGYVLPAFPLVKGFNGNEARFLWICSLAIAFMIHFISNLTVNKISELQASDEDFENMTKYCALSYCQKIEKRFDKETKTA